jgi:hypothetical protein
MASTIAKKKLSWLQNNLPDNVVLYASKLASCTGMNMYCPQAECKMELECYLKGEQYVSPMDRAKQRLLDMNASDPKAKAYIDNIMFGKYDNAKQVQTVLQALEINNSPDEAIMDLVKRTIYTKQGTTNEKHICTHVSHQKGLDIKKNYKFTVSMLPMCCVNGTEVYIGGKIDGYMKDKDGPMTIIEIKNRQRGFLGVPLYEKVQVHAYMFIFESRMSKLVESYMGEEIVHDIAFDDSFWSQVTSNVEEFFMSIIDEHKYLITNQTT